MAALDRAVALAQVDHVPVGVGQDLHLHVAVVAGTTGTPAARICSRAAVLEPIVSIASAGGPIQTSPARATARAKAAFSARKPYPGWIASAPARCAAST